MTIAPSATVQWRTVLLCVIATLAAHATSWSFPFVNWQDPVRILGPIGAGPLTLDSAMRTIVDLRSQPYQPVTDIVNGVNALAAGADPAAFHAVNIALLTLTALLLLLYLRHWRFGHIASAVGTLAFTLHPLRVEAVAWVSGRDELLATTLILTSAVAFHRYRSSGRRFWYLASLLASIAGLGSSISAAPWPVVLLLLDRPLECRTPRQRFFEFLPFFAASLAAVAIPVVHWISIVAANGLPPNWAIEAAASPAFALLFFLWKTLAPGGLSAVYAAPMLGLWWWGILAALALAVGLAITATQGRSASRAGVLWAVIFLLPVMIGLSDGPGPVSDRSTMLAAVGLSVMLAAFVDSLLGRQGGRWARPVKISAVLLLAVLGTLSSIQGEMWRSSVALWSRTTDQTPASALAHNYLGMALAQESGDLVRAEQSFSIALFHDPQMSAAFANRGATRAAFGRIDEALGDMNEALRIDPASAETRMARASLLRRAGRLDEALRDMHLALALQPMNIPWTVERAGLLLEMGRKGEAAAELEVLRQAGYEATIEP